MRTDDAVSLHQQLIDWEAQYQAKHSELAYEDLYMLWIMLYRLSRRVAKDYTVKKIHSIAVDIVANEDSSH